MNRQAHIIEAFDILESKNENGGGNGFIQLRTLRRVLTSLGEKMTEEEVESFITDMNVQEDGKISKEIFLQAFDIVNSN